MSASADALAPSPAHKDVHAAVAAVYAEVGYVHKGGRVDGREGGYTFAGEADILSVLRPSLVTAGLTVHVVSYESVDFGAYPTKSGGVMHTAYCRATVRFTHAASGTHFDVQALGFGADSGDKAIPKCQTIALKYALRQTFALETGDDPDKDASVEHVADNASRSRQGASGRSGATTPPSSGQGAPSGAPGAGNDPKPDWPVPPCPECGQAGTRRARATGKQPSFECENGCQEQGRDGKSYPKSYWRASDPSLKAAKASLNDYLTRNGMGGDAENARAEQAGIAQALGIPESSREWAQDHASRFIDACKATGTVVAAGGGTANDGDIPF